ncbi:MAG TPA: toll/interleukin-1 receptor domain-containing protein [Bryobacteraceae bacterium]
MTTATAGVTYDLFLSYNRQDQDAVLEVRRKLELRGIRTFLDRDNLVAGLPWPQALEQAQIVRGIGGPLAASAAHAITGLGCHHLHARR